MALPGMGAPEWPGAVSAKFTDKMHGKATGTKLVHSAASLGCHTSLANQGFSGYFTDTAGLAPESCKRVITCPQSDVHHWRPSRRTLAQPGQDHFDRPEGTRKVKQAPGKVYTIPEKRHIRQVESKEEHGDRPVGPHIVHRSNGLRAADQPAREVDIHMEMQRKVRGLHLMEKRNGIGIRSEGDKSYRHPEYDKRFFHAGGLVVGSTFTRGHYKPHEARSASNLKMVINPSSTPLVPYEEKMRIKERQELQQEVANLTTDFDQVTLREELNDLYNKLEEAKTSGQVADVQYEGKSGIAKMQEYVKESLRCLDDSDDDEEPVPQ